MVQDDFSKERDVTSDDEYSLSECFIKKDPETSRSDWSPNEHLSSHKCSLNEFGTRGYYSKDTKPFIKTEDSSTFSDDSMDEFEHDDKMLVKDELIKYPSELYTEFEYDEESDVSIEKFDPNSQLILEKSPCSPEIEKDKKPNIISLKDWLQLPANEYAQQCKNVPQISQPEDYLSEDDNSDSQSSYTGNQPPVQQAQGSSTVNEPNMYSSREWLQMDINKGPLTNHRNSGPQRVLQQANPRVYCNSRVKRASNSTEVKSFPVKKLRENRTADNFGVGKNGTTRERPEVKKKKPHHNYNRRMTRSLIKSIETICPTNNAQNNVGKFVWGYCMGWWPAIIVAAEDGGLESKPDKVCVYWIGEDLISLLNEKTQVEPFSSNLDARLLRNLKADEGTKDRRKACFVTLKLFSKYLNIPLLRPYITWAEKHLVGKKHLNELRFYPFPKNMQQRLDQLKRQNIKTTQKIAQAEAHAAKSSKESSSSNDLELRDSFDKKLLDNGTPQSKFPKAFVRKSTAEMLINSSAEQHLLPLMDQKPGVIVWGKITGHSWWPAMIIHSHDCGKKEPNFGCQWILWYGDYQLSQVQYQNVMRFEEGIKKMKDYISQCRREKYMKAVLNACKDHCARLNYDTSTWTMEEVLSWVSSLNSSLKMCAISRPNDGRLESRYSPHIAEKLNEMKSNQEIAAERENRIENCDALKAVFAGLPKTLEVLCIICLKICCNALVDHPFFECRICSDCVEELKATVFAYGDDGKCFYCTLCTGSDTVVMCDSYDCARVYCTACLKYLICPAEYNEILVKDPWLCFLCDGPQDPCKKQLFKPRSDWKTKLGQLFHTNKDTSWNNAWDSDGKTRNLRVLSLFDGIGTGLLTLEKLGIVVDDYYTSEIDEDAELVTKAYFGDRIYRLGDVRNITKDIIDAITPIDLLIGGSPCNDLSIVNPNRLGLHDPKGTGVLFFDYCRIKELIIEANRGHHLFWLFENVASMPSRYRLAINESLQCEPSLIDAADFSPQHRPRLFWGNLPSGVTFPPPDPSQDLQSVLTPNCSRHALVKKIRTVTTKVNSLKQGVSLLKPVLMNGQADSLWITELEEIFGFPKHYTDIKNLSATKRQKLIGQAWSVQTITALLLPLRYFFNTKDAVELPDDQ